tara:strand:- start:3477 stop:9398 length:5922 start_codon:yes stop_codon:yes gene_type:complete
MAKCPNKNTVKYKALLKVYKTDLVTTNVIQSWQQATGSEAIPTVTEAATYANEKKALHSLKQREFGEALLNNLRRERIIHSFQGAYYINNTEQGIDAIRPSDELIESNIKRLKRYLKINNLPESSIKLDKTPKTFAVTIDSSLFSAKDMIERSRSWDTPRARHVVQHLMRMFPNVGVKLMSVNEAQKAYDSLPQWKKAKVPFSEIDSFFVNDTAVLVKGRVTDEKAIEEMLHPFINAVKEDNIPLYESLLSEAKRNFPVMTQQIEDAYNKKRRVNAEEREMEIITQALARHFNKEYEETPTQGFLDKVKDLLEWFMNIIQNLNQYLTGRKIPVESINPEASLSDIAKLLNTSGIAFEIRRNPNGRVMYSLSSGKQQLVDQALKRSVTEQQQIVINNLFQNVQEAKNEADTLSGNNPGSFVNNLVVLNKSDNTFYDLNSNMKYESVSDVVGNKNQISKEIQNDVRTLLDGVASLKSFEEVADSITKLDRGQAEQVFEQIRNDLQIVMDPSDILITNVVLSDPKSKIAGIADVVIIDKFGKIKLGKLNIHTDSQSARANKIIKLPLTSLLINNNVTSLSQDVMDMLEVNLLRRMVENMGYDVQMGNYDVFSINMISKDNKIESESIVPRPPGQNLIYVDYLIPETLYDISGQQLDKEFEAADPNGQLYDARKDTEDLIESSQLDPYETQPLSYIFGAIEEYRNKLVTKKEMLAKTKANIFIDRTKPGIQEQIDHSLSIINFALVDPNNNKDISIAYTQLLQDAFRQMKDYKEYIIDPNNVGKREFVNYLLNFKKFLHTFEGLYELEEPGFEELNATQRYLINNINGTVTELLGPASGRKNGRQGLINRALFDYVGQVILNNVSMGWDEGEETVIQDHSGMTFTAADMEDLLTVVPDIATGAVFTKDIATSRDVILATLDKVYKRQWLKFLHRKEARARRIIAPIEKLIKLMPGVKGNRLYDFILNFDENGNLKQRAYVEPIGEQYYDLKEEISNRSRDENGIPLIYAPVYDLTKGSKEDIEYNKKLAVSKSEFSQFMRAEQVDESNQPVDGDFHRYSEEFKLERAKYEVWNSRTRRWEKRDGESDSNYKKYKAKYYESTRYTKAFKKNGEPTGQVKPDQNFEFVKPEYVEIREIAGVVDPKTRTFMDMRSEKYRAIMEPKVNDALAQARREFYDMFVEEYVEGMLQQLPRAERNQMLGKIPLVRDRIASSLQDNPAGGLFTRLWARSTRSIKNLFTSTSEQKTVVVDGGRMVDTLPIMYTGTPRVEERLTALENEVTQLKQAYKDGKDYTSSITGKTIKGKDLGIDKYQEQRGLLEGKIVKQRSQPTAGEVSTDLGSSLLMFNDMAEKFETMGEVEGTINALVKVIEKREYLRNEGKFTGVLDKIVPDKFNLKGRLGLAGDQANVVARAHKWLKMIYYQNDDISKKTMDKVSNVLIQWSSQSYVAWNIFGNINNLAIAQVNNAIEGVSNRYMTQKAFARGEYLYNTVALPGLIKRTGTVGQEAADIILGSEDITTGSVKGGAVGAIVGTMVAGPVGTAVGAALGGSAGAGLSGVEIKERSYKPQQANNQYEASAEFWRMMDKDMDIRESGMDNTQGQQSRFERGLSIGYLFQDGFEYAVQTKVGTSLLVDVVLKNSKTGETSNLYEAQEYNPVTGRVSYSDKWDIIIPNYKTGIEVKLDGPLTQNSKIYAEIRNNIREVNKQIHGNYSTQDRTVLQSYWLGKLLIQFKKWLAPALRARYQTEYFDANLGWVEGRYNSSYQLVSYLLSQMKQGRADVRNITQEWKESILKKNKSNPGGPGSAGSKIGDRSLQLRLDNKIKNFNRTMAEASFIIMSFLAFQMLDKIWDDEEDDDPLWVKKLRNWSKYQTDRVYTEMILFVPLLGAEEMGGFLERPIASTRMLGALAEAIILSGETPLKWLIRESDETFYENSSIVYQNKPRKGELKVWKQWKDALPILYTLQKWRSFERMDTFHLGN